MAVNSSCAKSAGLSLKENPSLVQSTKYMQILQIEMLIKQYFSLLIHKESCFHKIDIRLKIISLIDSTHACNCDKN
jgi:hypothetical protein